MLCVTHSPLRRRKQQYSIREYADGLTECEAVTTSGLDSDARVFAATALRGAADEVKAAAKRTELLDLMRAAGLTAGDGYAVVSTHDATVSTLFRRSDVLVPVTAGFDLWET